MGWVFSSGHKAIIKCLHSASCEMKGQQSIGEPIKVGHMVMQLTNPMVDNND